jgi:DNA-binding response OmpR family regulator
LLVDDDRELARLLKDYLGGHGVELEHVDDGATALDRLRVGVTHSDAPEGSSEYDIVLLDVMLPGIDGFEVCRRVRSMSQVPILMLTARGENDDRVTGLEIGADDYVPKPFDPRELLARMRAVVRRSKVAPPATERIEVGDIALDVPAHRATVAGRELELTSFEFRVLVALARRAGRTVTRDELARELLPHAERYDPSVDRSLDVHVSHLRSKLGDDARESRRIRTVRGVGYVLVRPPS